MSKNIVIVQDETRAVGIGRGHGGDVCLTFIESGSILTRTQVQAFFSVDTAEEIVEALQKLIKKMNAAA